ncbi:hypothetical protein H2199_004707 [Coniosporium tulheliwenetii]|uniref:Uncharacterized protein n=1 Tax=Coniosporium tulheliwenetii TaxID=3383036 RepID=A0ACC2Z3T0_9PEZI|nr:hypothetical protein H2199_004707 [Cladosporium sp. JES 115]
MAQTSDLKVEKLFSVKDYVCVITGGGSGIGLMAAQALAANDHPPSPCDVTSKDDLEKCVKAFSEKESHLDLLLTAAGISSAKAEPDTDDAGDLKAKLWDNETFEDWRNTYNTDVAAVYFSTVAFLPLLQAGTKKGGHLHASVIVISSMSGIMRDSQGHFSYNAAKGGTVHLTKLMSAEFQKVKIRVNSIAPGYFPSEMTAKESGDDQKSELPAEKVQEKGHVPAQRAGVMRRWHRRCCS